MLDLCGDAFVHARDDRRGCAELLPSFTNAPAIVVQRGRGVSIRQLVIRGKATSINPLTRTNLLSPTHFTGSWRDDRYSPYCGIAIDPAAPSKPSGGGYPGLSDLYNSDYAGGSSNWLIENVHIRNFAVGIAVSPGGYDSCGSEGIMDNVWVSYCRSAIAMGGSQNRSVTWRDGHVYGCEIAFDAERYGALNGSYGMGAMPAIFGGGVGQTTYLMRCQPRFGLTSAQGLYCESLLSLGWLGLSATADTGSASFTACSFTLAVPGDGPEASEHLSSFAPTTFTGCGFATPTSLRFSNRAAMNFIGCYFGGYGQTLTSLLPITYLNPKLATHIGTYIRDGTVGGTGNRLL
jgi:hypothetical protein